MFRLPVAVAAGLALWLSFPGHDIWPLAVLGVALLALATRGARPIVGGGLGFAAGMACFLPLLSWTGIYVGDLPWLALCVLESLYVGLLGWGSAVLQRTASLGGRDRVRPAAVALLWVLAEWLRATTPFGGFPWARLAFSQADSPLARLAALGGAPAVTFGVALTGGVLATVLLRRASPGRWWSRWGPTLVAAALAVSLPVLPLLVRVPVDGIPARFLAVQGNVAKPGLDFNAERRAVLDNHAQVTREAAEQVRAGSRPAPDLVVWPENASDIDPLRNPDAERVILGARDAIEAPLLVGAVLREPLPRLSNAALLYLPGSVGVVQRYVKQHPVPFAEYIPWRPFFRLLSDKVDLVQRDFAPGRGSGVFRVPTAAGATLAAGTVICFEVAYDSLVRQAVRDGANVLVVQTNNATFGFTDESAQQLAISRIRAIEHGRSVVHVSTVGVSALVTPDGRAHQTTALFTAAVLGGSLPLRDSRTLATQVGRWPEVVAAALAGLLLAGALRRSRGGQRPRGRAVTGTGYRRAGTQAEGRS